MCFLSWLYTSNSHVQVQFAQFLTYCRKACHTNNVARFVLTARTPIFLYTSVVGSRESWKCWPFRSWPSVKKRCRFLTRHAPSTSPGKRIQWQSLESSSDTTTPTELRAASLSPRGRSQLWPRPPPLWATRERKPFEVSGQACTVSPRKVVVPSTSRAQGEGTPRDKA